MNRLLVGHTHFDVDQRHSVLSRFLLGRLGPADRGRRVLHSLSAFKTAVEQAHSDLKFFSECTANYNFDEWLKTMESKHEPGLAKHLQYQLRRNGDVIMARSKPRMSAHVPYTPWYQIWPVDRDHWPAQHRCPTAPSWDSKPTVCPPQQWKHYDEVRKSLHQFYSDDWWGVGDSDKYEMEMLLRKWGENPSLSCPDPPEWPDFTVVMPIPAVPLSRPVEPPRRPAPLITAPYQPLAMPRSRGRGRGRARGRGRGRGRGHGRGRSIQRGRGRRRVRARGRGRGRGRSVERGRGRGRSVGRGRGRGRGRGGVSDEDSSSEEEFVLSRRTHNRRRRIVPSSSTDTDTEENIPLNEFVSRLRSCRYPIGTRIRKKFGDRYYNGRVVRVDSAKKQWHVKYSDDDSESLSEGEVQSCVQLYNKNN